jgi:hypothetical protein
VRFAHNSHHPDNNNYNNNNNNNNNTLPPAMVQDWTRDSLPRHQTFQPQYYSADAATRHQSFSSERYTSDVVQRHHPFPQDRVGVEADNARFQDGNDSRRHLMVSLQDILTFVIFGRSLTMCVDNSQLTRH